MEPLGRFWNDGQRCTAASRLIVHEKIHDSFLERFVPRVKSSDVSEMDWSRMSDMGPCINESQLKKVESYVQTGREEGAKLLCGGERLTGQTYDHGYFFSPTVFAK